MLPLTGDTLRPLLIALAVFGAAIVVTIIYLLLRRRGK